MDLWDLVFDQVLVLGKRARLDLAAVAAVITLYGLKGEEALEMLYKLKILSNIYYNHGK